MIGFVGKRRSAAAFVAFGFLSLPVTTAWAADNCLVTDNPCDPNKLCTFQAELAAKKLTYDTWYANRPGAKGKLYAEALSEAKAELPKGTRDERLVQAGANLEAKVKVFVKSTFKLPTCSSGALDRTLVPKAGYEGMHTDAACRAWVDFESGESFVEGFGADHATSCPEFYDRDRAHEAIHQARCKAAKDTLLKDRFHIDQVVAEELIAYGHSVKLSQAYVRLLSLQCSAKRTPDTLKARAKKVQDLLTPYLSKAR